MGWGFFMSTDLARKLRRNATEPERAMWRILWPLRQAGWHFRRQVQIGAYYADFACLDAKLVIEVDGDTHGADQISLADSARDEYMASRGILVLRFSNADVMQNAEGVFSEVASVLGAVSRATNTPTPDPSPQGGGRGRTTRAEPPNRLSGATSSPSPRRGGDGGGGSA